MHRLLFIPVAYRTVRTRALLEARIGKYETAELAVMLDTFYPLKLTAHAKEYDVLIIRTHGMRKAMKRRLNRHK